MNKVILIDENVLRNLYLEECKPMHEIARELGVAVGTVYNYIKLYEIPSRPRHQGFKGKHHTEEAKAKISVAHTGRTFSKETIERMSASAREGGIGHKKLRGDGYVSVYFPDHPCSTEDGYIMEHILVMEALIGRHLKDDECVHHINGNRNDNRKENLKLMTKSEHMSFHTKKRWEEKKKGGMTYQ